MNTKAKIPYFKRGWWVAITVITLIALVPAVMTVFADADNVTDPAGDYMEWPESELFLTSPTNTDTAKLSLVEPDTSLASFTLLGEQAQASSESWERAAASGRILTPEHDSIGYLLASAPALKFRFYEPQSDWLWQAADMWASPKNSFCNSFMDIAAGDLDRYMDAEANYRDEVIVAYAGQSANNLLPVKLAVLDFSASTDTAVSAPVVTTAQAPGMIDSQDVIDQTVFICADNALGISTGDFNGDGVDEIAAAYRMNSTQYRVDMYSYTTTVNATTGVKTHSLTLADTDTETLWWPGDHSYISLDTAAGDFDGDGVDEVTVAYSTTPNAYDNYVKYTGRVYFDMIKFYPAPSWGKRYSQRQIPGVDSFYPIRVQIDAGLFGQPYDWECNLRPGCVHPNLIGSQLAYAYGYGGFRVGYLYYWFSDPDNLNTEPVLYPNWIPGDYISVTAGGFEGDRSPDNYAWSIAYHALFDERSNVHTTSYFFGMTPGATSSDPPTMTQKGAYTSASVERCISCIQRVRMPAIAADIDGDSIYLGAPVPVTIEDAMRVHFILQEPPKHAYWDQWGKQQDLNGTPGLVTISRWQEFTSSLKLDSGQESTHSTKKTSSNTTGYSVYEKAGLSYQGPLKKRTVGAEESSKWQQDWESEESTYNNNLVSTKWSFETETTWDDGIRYTLERYDLWRYPIYGSQYVDEQGNTQYGFMDIMVPYSTDTVEYMGPAANVDGWEPTWENGNILSYPRYNYAQGDVNKFLQPDDLGVFYIPCQTGMTGCELSSDDPNVYVKKIEQVMGSTQLAVGGTQDTKDYTLSGSAGSGQEQTYKETFSYNADASAYYKKEPSKKKGGFGLETEVGGSFDSNSSESDASTAETKTETSRTVTISRPALETTYGYNFYPELYVTQDGAMKLAYAAEPPAANTPAAEFWENIYGDSWKYGPGKPDAALNLPNRFRPVINSANGYLSGWAVETDEVRERIRGFFIREATPDSETGEYLLLSHEVTAGETVRLEARVYNYTLSEANGYLASVTVHFYATWRDWSNPSKPVDYVQEIGTTTVTDLEPREWKIAAINWTPELKGTAGTTQEWRVFVELDPDNLVDEIYDTDDPATFCILPAGQACGTPQTNPENYIDPGQNNIGFRQVSVLNGSLSGAPLHNTLRDESLSGNALMVFSNRLRLDNQLRQVLAGLRPNFSGNKITQLRAGERAFVRIQVESDKSSILASRVVLYDGDPQNGGKLIAIKRVHPGILGSTGNVAWVEWSPLTIGTHTLYARLLEPGMDTNPGNNVAQLNVMVLPPVRLPRR